MATVKSLVAVAAVLGVMASAKEMPVNMKLKADMYEGGLVHEQIMAVKHVSAVPDVERAS
jgi:hypothetical protein